MKKLTLICSFLLLIIFYSCQREIDRIDSRLTIASAKEWYYGTFKKSVEYGNAINSTGIKRYPDWKHGIEQSRNG